MHGAALFVLGGIGGASFLLILSTLSFWLSESGLSKATIGLFVITTGPYAFKFLIPRWIHYFSCISKGSLTPRCWLVFAQLGLCISLTCLGLTDPKNEPWLTALCATMVAFFGVLHDCVVDGIRLMCVPDKKVAWAASLETVGFRIGMICGGAGALCLAHYVSWQIAYMISGFLILGSGLISVMLGTDAKGVSFAHNKSSQGYRAVWMQLWRNSYFLTFLLWIVFFKLSDTMLNAMMSPFLWDLGFSKIEVAHVTKFFGLGLTVVGSLLGAISVSFFGLFQTIILCAIGQCLSCLLFVVQMWVGHHLGVLMITIGIESLVSGLSNAVFLIVLSYIVRAHPSTAMSSFVILCSIGSLVRVVGSTASGWMADSLGWIPLFGLGGVLLLPTILLTQKICSTICVSMKHPNSVVRSFFPYETTRSRYGARPQRKHS